MDHRRSRRYFSSSGNAHLHLKDISALRRYTKKKAIKPNPHLTHRTTGFQVPPAFPTIQSISSLQIKSFQPLLLESTCVFILRAGSRTLST
jgi:hypothetical protein